jgi:hypothetical protein
MSSILKVNDIQDAGGNSIISSDGSGTFTPSSALATGVLANTPAFHAYRSSDQSISEESDTKIQFNTEQFDTDGCYDNTTNYRFTPTVAGKYFIYGGVYWVQGTTTNIKYTGLKIYKNGSVHRRVFTLFTGSYVQYHAQQIGSIVEFNGSTDYVEIYGIYDTNNNGGCNAFGGADVTYFGGYKLIG